MEMRKRSSLTREMLQRRKKAYLDLMIYYPFELMSDRNGMLSLLSVSIIF